MRFVVFLVSAIALTGCTATYTSLNVPNMAVPAESIQNNSLKKFQNNIFLEDVKGGNKMESPIHSTVTNEDFTSALKTSLKQANLLSENQENAMYIMKADVVHIGMPKLKDNISVDATIIYTLSKANDERIIYQKAHGSTGVSKKDESFNPIRRLKIANEEAVRNNISSFLRDLQK